MQSIRVLALLLAITIVAAPSNAEPSIEYPLESATMEKPDERAMSDHMRSAINLQCEFVKFDPEPLVALIDEIESGAHNVGETSISLRFLDGTWLKYIGTTSEVGQSQPQRGPHVWEGAASGSDSFATFVVQLEAQTKAYISKSGVMHVLYPSSWSNDYFLCIRDPEFRGRKID